MNGSKKKGRNYLKLSKFVYIVGLPVWAGYYGELMPNTIKIFKNSSKALKYMVDQNIKLTKSCKLNRYIRLRRKLN